MSVISCVASALNFPTTLMVQYWRSFEDLAVYAGDKNAFHLPAWREFNRRVGSNGDVGIWHETWALPSRITVQQPHCPVGEQPSFGEVTSSSSRSAARRWG